MATKPNTNPSNLQAPAPINFPTEEELRKSAQARFGDIRSQQALDRSAAQGEAQATFGEGSLGRVAEGRAAETRGLLNQGVFLQQTGQQLQAQAGAQAQTGAAGLDQAIARRQATIAAGGNDPAFRQIEEAATRAQDIQTQTSLRQLRGDLGAQGVRGGINIQNQLGTLGGANQAQSALQAQLAQARLGRVGEAESAIEGLQSTRIGQQQAALGAQQNAFAQQQQALGQQSGAVAAAQAGEAQRADTNVQRALQERLGRLQLTESRAQAGTLERAAASQEVSAQAQLRSQLEQQNIANKIAFAEAVKPQAETKVIESGGTVLCTEMHRQGLISSETLEGDLLYAQSVVLETKVGYWVWAKPLANKCKTSKVLTRMALPLVKAWATEMAHRVGKAEKGSVLGKILSATGEPSCNLLGRALIKFNLVDLEQLSAHVTLIK